MTIPEKLPKWLSQTFEDLDQNPQDWSDDVINWLCEVKPESAKGNMARMSVFFGLDPRKTNENYLKPRLFLLTLLQETIADRERTDSTHDQMYGKLVAKRDEVGREVTEHVCQKPMGQDWQKYQYPA